MSKGLIVGFMKTSTGMLQQFYFVYHPCSFVQVGSVLSFLPDLFMVMSLLSECRRTTGGRETPGVMKLVINNKDTCIGRLAPNI